MHLPKVQRLYILSKHISTKEVKNYTWYDRESDIDLEVAI